MSRRGAVRADVDTGLMDDPKVKKLVRRQRNEQATATTLVVYIATLLDSWAEDEPIAAVDAVPGWITMSDESIERVIADLKAVELLDASGRIPIATLDHWMEGVHARRAAGRIAAAVRWHSEGNAKRMPRPDQPVGLRGSRENGQRELTPGARSRTRGMTSAADVLREIDL